MKIQAFANQAANYKAINLLEIVPEKKRRGRAVTRRDKKVANYQVRVLRDGLLAQLAQRDYHKEKKAFEKSAAETKSDVTEVPENVRHLQQMAFFHKANLETALVVNDVMRQFPPLS